MRLRFVALIAALPVILAAQAPAGDPAVRALVARILSAEDRRDTADAALREGLASRDARVAMLARRALARSRDAKFAARDSFPAAAASPAWPEPAWKVRYRALRAPVAGDCDALRNALADEAPAVRLRAMDLVSAQCAQDDGLAVTLGKALTSLPDDVRRREPGMLSWHAAAHALVALAKARPALARPEVPRLAQHRQWQLRMYAARAAEVLTDTATLRKLARDRDDNVAATAIEGLSHVTRHADDALFLEALDRTGAQVIRAAANALRLSPRADVPVAASATFDRLVARANASERDARLALLAAARRSARDDQPPQRPVAIPAEAVDLALGATVRLKVTMSESSGGGSFVVRLRGDLAPITAGRILALVRTRYYDGLTWHRVEHDYVIQGGSPAADEYVGYRDFFRDELGTLPHPRGTLGMSTRGHDTGDAQWFVNLRDNARLAAEYTVWGEVVSGMDVVDGVQEGDVIARIEELPAGAK